MATRNGSPWSYAGAAGGILDTANNILAAAPADAKQRNYIANLQYHNSAAVISEIVVKDAATVIWRGRAPASMGTPATVTFDPPLFASPGAALNVAMITTATATVVSAQGFIDY